MNNIIKIIRNNHIISSIQLSFPARNLMDIISDYTKHDCIGTLRISYDIHPEGESSQPLKHTFLESGSFQDETSSGIHTSAADYIKYNKDTNKISTDYETPFLRGKLTTIINDFNNKQLEYIMINKETYCVTLKVVDSEEFTIKMNCGLKQFSEHALRHNFSNTSIKHLQE